MSLDSTTVKRQTKTALLWIMWEKFSSFVVGSAKNRFDTLWNLMRNLVDKFYSLSKSPLDSYWQSVADFGWKRTPPPPPPPSGIWPPADPKVPPFVLFWDIYFWRGTLKFFSIYSDLGELRKSIWVIDLKKSTNFLKIRPSPSRKPVDSPLLTIIELFQFYSYRFQLAYFKCFLFNTYFNRL